MWDLLGNIFSFREIRMLQNILAQIKKLPGYIFSINIKQVICCLMIIVELFGNLIFATPQKPRGQQINLDEWNLVWSDEFNGDELDLNSWNETWNYVRRGGIWHKDQAFVNDGNLIIRTENKTSELGTGWHSTEVTTANKFEHKYGYYEVSCICPAGNGLWAAFWMLSEGMFAPPTGSAANGCEIDLFESGNHGAKSKKQRDCVNQATGFDGYTAGISQGIIVGNYYGKDIYTTYNTYGLEWTPTELIFYINGVETDRLSGKWVPQVELYLLLSVEVRGEGGNAGLGGEEVPFAENNDSIWSNDPSIFPLDFKVDYVRVYDRKPA